VLQPPKFGNFTNYRDILRPYEIGIGAYSKVNIKYINPLTYDGRSYYETNKAYASGPLISQKQLF
jgi:hypothetical protein